MEKKGQFQISFGVIFAIILIIVFLTFGFYAISKFINIQQEIKIKEMQSSIQKNVNTWWEKQEGTSTYFEYMPPSKVQYVCVADSNADATGHHKTLYKDLRVIRGNNFYFYPSMGEGLSTSFEIEHLDLDTTLEDNNPLCFKVTDEKIKIKFETIRGNPGVILRT